MKKMNMITHMNRAWEQKQKLDLNTYEEYCKNLVTHAYVELEKMYKGFCKEKNIEYKNEIFIIFQHIFVCIIKCDGEFLQGEYDAYCKYCEWAGFNPLLVKEVNNLYEKLSVDTLSKDIGLIVALRKYIEDDNYESMVKGFCYLSLLGDNKFDENEYYIIRNFYDQEFDYVPKDWETFKKEWC